MIKKGAEPAGLKRYRLAHKKSGTKKRGTSVSTKTTKRKRNGIKLPVAVILGFMPLVAKGVGDFQAGGFQGMRNTVSALVPYDVASGRVTFQFLHMGLWPIIGGLIVHKIVGGAFGVNRALGAMGLPWLRI